MEALTGSLPERAVRAIEAGCDLALACHVAPAEMVALAAVLPDITDQTQDRLNRAVRHLSPGKDVDKIAALIDKRDALLAYAL
jgi:beta-N-acetylhexosaminidase